MNQIMQVCHWKVHNTFTNFYLKDLTWLDNDNNMYLGPVVVAQVPSDCSSSYRKEGDGGHLCCSQVFRSLIAGSRYWLPPQDVMVRSIIYIKSFSVLSSHI